jgi:hypothetical protein
MSHNHDSLRMLLAFRLAAEPIIWHVAAFAVSVACLRLVRSWPSRSNAIGAVFLSHLDVTVLVALQAMAWYAFLRVRLPTNAPAHTLCHAVWERGVRTPLGSIAPDLMATYLSGAGIALEAAGLALVITLCQRSSKRLAEGRLHHVRHLIQIRIIAPLGAVAAIHGLVVGWPAFIPSITPKYLSRSVWDEIWDLLWWSR